LDKLKEAEEQVSSLSEMIIAKQPELEKTLIEVDAMMIQIEADKVIANETQQVVSVQEADANVKASEAKEIKDSAQIELDKAIPALEAAVKCLNELTNDHINEVKHYLKPPTAVVLVCEAVCIMKSINPVKVNDPNKMGAKIND